MISPATMRRSILDVLAYPRRVAMANVDLSACPHSGRFKAIDPRCRKCSKSYECNWLTSTEEFADLDGRSLEFLYRALTFGIDYIDADYELADHDDDACECESCVWIRTARRLAHVHGRGA